MTSNFEFLSRYWPDLSELGNTAETYLYTDSNTCVLKTGLIAEIIVRRIFQYEKMEIPSDDSQVNLINVLRREDLLPENIDKILYLVRKARNEAAHQNVQSLDKAKSILRQTFSLCGWFMSVYGDFNYKPQEYIEPKENEKNKDELAQHLADQEKKIQELSEKLEYVQTLTSELDSKQREDKADEVAKEIEENKENDSIGEKKIEVEVNYLDIINCSMQQNGTKIISSITIKNTGTELIDNLLITVTSDPLFTLPYTFNVENLGDNEGITLKEVDVKLDVNYLVNLTERIVSYLNIKIEHNDEVLYDNYFNVNVLAFDQWAGTKIIPELTCSFITPNHPEISKIIGAAAEVLMSWDRKPSFNGYQSKDRNIVLLQVAAIYSAIQKMNIVYSEAPASYEKYGQRVRLPETIAQQKLGTCLDLTLLFASCLEAIGLNPLLLFEKAHIFCGVWLDENVFPDTISDDSSIVAKRFADGINDIAVFECTSICMGQNISFNDAQELAKDEIIVKDAVEYVIDVKSCRYRKIVPLPIRINENGVWKIEHKDDNQDQSKANIPNQVNSVYVDIQKEKEYSKKVQWERKLLDLGLRNSLINLHITNRSIVPILSSSMLDKLEDSLSEGKLFDVMPCPAQWQGLRGKGNFEAYCGNNDLDDFFVDEIDKKRLYSPLEETDLNNALKNLYRSAKTSLEENGANTLFLTIGLLKWYETKTATNPHYAPLILLPVDLTKRSANAGYFLSLREEEPQVNITLLEKLNQDFGIDIDTLDELPIDNSGLDIRKILTIFRKSIITQPHWDILESSLIGIFSFSQFVMWNDIHSRSADLEKNKIVKSLLENKLSWQAEDMIFDGEVNEDDSYITMPVDASQLFAIKESVKDKSFVLHGPPGTGKSQTITALIANALTHNKTVLFVAEKRAALEVVEKRLNDIGVGPFCIELHSNKAKKSDVLDQFRIALEVGKKADKDNYAQKLEHINAVKRELDVYAKELHKVRDCGYSIYELINNYEKNIENKYLSDPYFGSDGSFNRTKIENQIIEIQNLINSANLVGEVATNPLRPIRKTELNHVDKVEGTRLINNYITSLNKLLGTTSKLTDSLKLDLPNTYDEQKRYREVAQSLLRLVDYPQKWVRQEQASFYLENVKEMSSQFDKSISIKNNLLKSWKESFFDINPSVYLDQYNINEAKWFLPKAIGKSQIAKSLSAYAVIKVNKSTMQNDLNDLIVFNKADARAKEYFKDYGSDLGDMYKGDNTDWKYISNLSKEVQDTINEVDQWLNDFEQLRFSYAGDKDLVSVYTNYIHTFDEMEKAKQSLFDYFNVCNEKNTYTWIKYQLDIWSNALNYLDNIRDWTLWNKQCESAKNAGLSAVVESLYDGISSSEVLGAYKRSVYYNMSIKEIEKVKILNEFSGTLFNGKIEQFKQLDNELKTLNQKQVYYKLASNVPNITSFAAQSSEMGILQKAINNKGRGVSLRKLFEKIPNLIEKLAPCMLMSPISAAQYLDPNRKPFDLVVFDEASQLQTCKAVGAIARGTNAIIVGDPKQMPPTSFFMTKIEDEDNVEYEDAESILDDCINLSMPQTKLLWHYRSHHESLIAFSNSEFYNNELYTFPSVNDRESKVSLVKIQGTYRRKGSAKRTNLEEAQAIVKEIKRRSTDPELSKKSIGVVTFNIAQKDLIEDLLDEETSRDNKLDTWRANAKEPLFVKNLENVQGDERDVILFSICYGPDEDGKKSMNFSPLNREGGYRRLNVAVSRARDEMIVFSSITSDYIDTSRTNTKGTIALKNFLEYASTGRLNIPYSPRNNSNYKNTAIIDSICKSLEYGGYKCDKLVGHSEYKVDIAVVDPENEDSYILGIELDGNNYRDAKSTRDRELGQINVLNNLGWKIVRIWTLDWWENPQKVLNYIKQLLSNKDNTNDDNNSNKSSEPKWFEDDEFKNQPKIIQNAAFDTENSYKYESFKCADLDYQYDPGDFPHIPEHRLISALKKIIENEAPITESLLCKRIANYYGASRVTDNIRRTIRGVRNRLQHTKDGEVVYWKNNDFPKYFLKYRVVSEEEPKIDFADIPMLEIANAICYLLKLNFAIPKENIIKETAKLMGYDRAGQNIRDRICNTINYAVNKNMISQGTNDCYVLTDDYLEVLNGKSVLTNIDKFYESSKIGKPIGQFDDYGVLIKKYNTITEASKNMGVDDKCIRDAANGKQKHAAGYVWKYI